MALMLNESEKYKEFYGRNVDQMPLLVAEGRTPMSVSDLMTRRLEVAPSKNAPFRASWTDNYFDTGDAILYHPDGRIKVVHDSQILRGMTDKSKRVGGALVLEDGVFDSADGTEFSARELSKMIREKPLTAKEAKAHPLWNALARDDKKLLGAYVDTFFPEMNTRFQYDEAMGLYLDSARNTPKARSWVVGRLLSGSVACGWDDLDDIGGRLVGLASETQSGEKKVRLGK